MSDTSPVLIVTGTGTEVGKTITTAAMVVGLRGQGLRIAVVKATQTGLQPGEPGDLDDVRRLAGDVETHELLRLPDPLAPDAAARHIGGTLPTVAEHADTIAHLAAPPDPHPRPGAPPRPRPGPAGGCRWSAGADGRPRRHDRRPGRRAGRAWGA